MVVEGGRIDELIDRIDTSVAEAVFEETTGLLNPPAPRESWIELQGQAVALGGDAAPGKRRELARALLRAILRQPSFGPSNRLSAQAFAFVLGAAPDELAASLVPRAGVQYGGQRYLRLHVWSLRGGDGARWLGILARADPRSSMPGLDAAIVSTWTPQEWSERLAVVAGLPVEPRPALVALFAVTRPPRSAMPGVGRVAIVHGRDERDPLFRLAADRVREYRVSAEDSVELFDWEARHARPELFRWLLELSGDAGTRGPLLAASVRAGRLPAHEEPWLAEPLDRPAWADGKVPWELDGVVVAGELRLPDGELTGGDPWWTGGAEGFPWRIEVPAGSFQVRLVIAKHPLAGRECAALELLLDGETAVERWSLVRATSDEEGYRVEVGVASLGAPSAYGAPIAEDFGDAFFRRPRPAWDTADGGVAGTIVLCSVGPQHQLCRTWIGSASGRPVAVVTDLGLLELELARNRARPWHDG